MDRQLEYIQKIAQYGSILHAAERLYITPSALSKYVQKIESSLNVKLFDRVGKSFVLTYAGERYLYWHQEIESVQQEMLREMWDISNSYKGRIRLGLQRNGTGIFLKQILPEFHEKLPDVQLDLVEETSSTLRQMLEESKIDVAVLPDGEFSGKIKTTVLCDDVQVLVVPENHEVLRYAVQRDGFPYPWVDISHIREEPFITPFPKQDSFTPFSDLQRKFDFTPKIIFQAQSIGTILRFVANGFGVTISYDNIVKSNNLPDVVLLTFGDEPIWNHVVLAHNKDHYIDYVTQELIKRFIEFYKDLYRGDGFQKIGLPQ